MMEAEQSLEGSTEEQILKLFKSTDLLLEKESFNALENPTQRLEFVYNSLIKSPRFQQLVAKKKLEKSNDESFNYRTQGNDLYVRNKKYLEALKLYTKSIAFAENESSFQAIAYANRSAVLFEKKYYKECLEDIERALANNYPGHLKDKLLARQTQANKLQSRQKPIKYYTPEPPITDKNSRIIAASDSVEIQQNEKYGRHVVATKNIKVGDIISAEDFFTHNIHPESEFIHCHECLELCYNMIPCKSCPIALYCSEKCLIAAFDAYHKYECDFFPFLHQQRFLFTKMAVKGLKERQAMGDDELDEVYRSDRFKEINALIINDDTIDFLNLCIHIIMACLAYHGLKNSPSFLLDYDFNSLEKDLKMLLYRTSMICVFNPFNIKKLRYTPFDIKSTRVATAIYSFTSIYNHSCVPNCQFFHHGRVLVTRALANIKKGEQCTLSYGISFSTTDIQRRRMILKKSYLFDCDCKACVGKWPVYNYLPLGKQLPMAFEMKASGNTFDDSDANNKLLQELLKDGYRLIGVLEKYEPCKNYLKIQNMIEETFSYFGCKDVEF